MRLVLLSSSAVDTHRVFLRLSRIFLLRCRREKIQYARESNTTRVPVRHDDFPQCDRVRDARNA